MYLSAASFKGCKYIMDSVCTEIGLNCQHIAETNQPLRYTLICDKQWLQTLEKKRKIADFPSHPELDKRAHPQGELEHPWCRILLQLFKKKPNEKAYPLTSISDRNTATDDCINNPLSYSQTVYDISSTNFHNLWQNFIKCCPSANIKSEPKQYKKMIRASSFLAYDIVLKELISIVFKCSVIHCKRDRLNENSLDISFDKETFESHSNIMQALITIETSSYFVVFFYPPCISTSLYDCITFSPAILNNNYNKPMFLIYELLQVYKFFHSQELLLGNIFLQDIFLKEDLWIFLVPDLEANISPLFQDDGFSHSPSEVSVLQDSEIDQTYEGPDLISNSNVKLELKLLYDYKQLYLIDYCEMWCNGLLSNYDYITLLNNAAGRTLNNPSYHHIMPWVTDFSSRNGANWRDLSKSKYRLNKGDVQLDFMFQHAGQRPIKESEVVYSSSTPQISHHVSDFLSEITYFVYMARRTPQHILREHVRPIWVPAEYPVSIQRLQEWTPDECIPEFYSDPMIFKTIHEDLPDLEIPSWASCPEDFICKHREALESQYVSERLHHWIDLNFGFKLSGKAAVKSKNVCLALVDQHKNITQRGVVQLFAYPHPFKRTNSKWFSKDGPRIQNMSQSKIGKSGKTNKQYIPKHVKPLTKSIENLNRCSDSSEILDTINQSNSKTSPKISHKTSHLQDETTSNFYKTTNFIELPKDYNPCSLLLSLEASQQFIAKTFPLQKLTENAQEKIYSSDLLFEDYCENHSYTNQLFNDLSPTTSAIGLNQKSKSRLIPSAKVIPAAQKSRNPQCFAEKMQRDLQILGCLIVEIFAFPKLRPLIGHNLTPSFKERIKACLTAVVIYKQEIPKSLRKIALQLLNLDSQNVITEDGLPLPTAKQLLEPMFYNFLIPFPCNFYPTYNLMRSLQSFDFVAVLLEIYTHFHCNGLDCSKYVEIDRLRVLYERKIAKCKVMSACAHIRRLLEPVAYEQFPSVELILPHIIKLLTEEHTSILAAWNLFDAASQSLGITQTQKLLLQPLMKLYDVESFERGMTSVRNRSLLESVANVPSLLRFSTSSSFKSRKSVKLYHQIFLLRLMVRYGLKCFLRNFIAPLIEAVGGYKEPEDSNGLHYHSSALGRRFSRSLTFGTSITGNEEDQTLISDKKFDDFDDNTFSAQTDASYVKADAEGVFCFEDDLNSDNISTSDHVSSRSLDSFDMRPTTAEEAKEDVRHLDNTPEKQAITEIIYGTTSSNNSLEDLQKNVFNIQDPISDSLPNTHHFGPRSPTIAIPENVFHKTYQLNAIDCDIGSKKSVDSFEILQNTTSEERMVKREGNKCNQRETDIKDASNIAESSSESCDTLQASVISKMSEEKCLQNNCISEMSCKSLIWLSHRLGPVLTSRFIARNLLKMLTLCYVGQENLLPEAEPLEEVQLLNYFTVSDARVVGDRSAMRVLECLTAIPELYGEEVILLQYFPHMSELVVMSAKIITGTLEGSLISTLQLLKCIIPCLTDATIMEHLQDLFLEAVILPVLRFLASSKILMPSGYLGRSVLARKLLDAIYVLSVRLGPDMTREHLCNSVLRPFFLIFDKAFGESKNFKADKNCFGISPPTQSEKMEKNREIEELRDVFSPALAYSAYITFLQFLGEEAMKKSILNIEFILMICHEFESPDYKSCSNILRKSSDAVDCPDKSLLESGHEQKAANSFGTQVVGNRIEVSSPVAQPSTINKSGCALSQCIDTTQILDIVASKFDRLPKTRYLKGNWLAYWRHEITRPDKDSSLSLQQIKLQSFIGHSNSVRALLALDNENSFMSASKDKTVKLWSLRSEGDGTKATSCQFTYTAHKKSIHSLAFLDSMRFVVSCDSGVHIWDPFIGRPLGVLDSYKHNPITVVKCLPSPSPLVLAGTAEASVKIIDARCMQYVNEWRVSTNVQNSSTVRCLTVAPSGNWIAVGLSSGSIVMLDTRTGLVLNSWRPTECDILQLAAPHDQQLISSALDHSLAVWHAQNGILHYQLLPPAEPAHFLYTIDSELVYATTGNRIGIYSDVSSSHASHNVTKLRSENFKGVLTSLAVLPLNHAFLAGNESGNISLFC